MFIQGVHLGVQNINLSFIGGRILFHLLLEQVLSLFFISQREVAKKCFYGSVPKKEVGAGESIAANILCREMQGNYLPRYFQRRNKLVELTTMPNGFNMNPFFGLPLKFPMNIKLLTSLIFDVYSNKNGLVQQKIP